VTIVPLLISKIPIIAFHERPTTTEVRDLPVSLKLSGPRAGILIAVCP
jgi:hypothetical protein